MAVFTAFLAVSAGYGGETGKLKIIADPGLILVDGDTLDSAGELEIELPAGDHELRFFPYHTADEWVHRYLVYPFSLGAAGQRTIDLTRRDIFTIRSDPQAAVLLFRGRYLGLTPGEYMLPVGSADSVVVQIEGYENQVLQLDELYRHGTDLFVSLEPRLVEKGMPTEELEAYQYHSPFRKLASLDLMLSLGGGIALLAVGAHFNQKADSYYTDYLRILGTRAREDAYSKMKRFDRLSKTSFIAGDAALGLFGYMMVRRFIFPTDEHKRQEPDRLSLKFQGRSAALSYKF